MPAISIGLPVFNGINTIKSALESILDQSYKNFEVIVFDNASIDGTYEYLLEASQRDGRIKIYRNQSLVDPMINFKNCLAKAGGKYFMWWAADDIRSVNYLERNINFLLQDENLIASTSISKFENQKSFDYSVTSLVGNQSTRIKLFTRISYKSQSLFYSLIRLDELKNLTSINLFDKSTPIIDWIIIIDLLLIGNFYVDTESQSIFGATGASSNPNEWKRHRTSKFRFIIYYYDLILFLMRVNNRMCFKTKITLSFWATKLQVLYFLNLIFELGAFVKSIAQKS